MLQFVCDKKKKKYTYTWTLWGRDRKKKNRACSFGSRLCDWVNTSLCTSLSWHFATATPLPVVEADTPFRCLLHTDKDRHTLSLPQLVSKTIQKLFIGFRFCVAVKRVRMNASVWLIWFESKCLLHWKQTLTFLIKNVKKEAFFFFLSSSVLTPNTFII